MGAEYVREREKYEFVSRFNAAFTRELCVLRRMNAFGHINPDHIASLPLRALNEIAQRFDVSDKGVLYDAHFINTSDPCRVRSKFLTVSGQTPPSEIRVLDRLGVEMSANALINASRGVPNGTLAAVIVHGSHFEPWKKPSSDSDLDLILVFEDHSDKLQWENARDMATAILHSQLGQMRLDIRVTEIGKLTRKIVSINQHNQTIAEQFRCTNNIGISRTALIVGDDNQQAIELSRQMQLAAYPFSDLPTSDIVPKLVFWANNPLITPEGIASYISEPSSPNINEYFRLQ